MVSAKSNSIGYSLVEASVSASGQERDKAHSWRMECSQGYSCGPDNREYLPGVVGSGRYGKQTLSYLPFPMAWALGAALQVCFTGGRSIGKTLGLAPRHG